MITAYKETEILPPYEEEFLLLAKELFTNTGIVWEMDGATGAVTYTFTWCRHIDGINFWIEAEAPALKMRNCEFLSTEDIRLKVKYLNLEVVLETLSTIHSSLKRAVVSKINEMIEDSINKTANGKEVHLASMRAINSINSTTKTTL